MALLDSLPANWSTFTPAEKISYFNQKGVTPAELAQAGVSASDIAWMQSQGYTGGAAPVAAAPTTATIAPARAAVPAVPAQTDRLKEVDQWVYSKEPKAFQDLYKAVQSGEARIGLVPDEIKFDPDFGQIYGDYGVFDANGKFMPDVQVDPNTGVISVGTKNGVLRLSTNIGQGGTLAPIQGENYQNQVKYESFGNTWDEWGPAILAIGSLVGAPYLSSLIGGATGLTGAGLSAATGATIGGLGAAATGGDILKGALLGGAGGYLGSSLTGAATPTDLGMNSQLTPAAIEAGLGTPGYGFNASAAQSGLFNPAMIGAGAYTQTSYPYDMADFLAADVKQLYGQVGSNIPAIEQNLVASGVDPLVAADVANQVTLNPNISQYDLTNYIASNFGGNVYDVNMATQYPTSQIPGEGGLLSNVAGLPVTSTTPSTTPPTTTPSTLKPSDISNLVKAGVSLAGLAGAGGLLGGGGGVGGGVGALPTQGIPTNTPEYYQAIQQYYNAYMPNVPRDVATPLQQWYESKYGA